MCHIIEGKCIINSLEEHDISPSLLDVSESCVSLERDSASEDECALTPDTTPTDGSDALRHQNRDGFLQNKAAVAEAALQDGEPFLHDINTPTHQTTTSTSYCSLK